MYWNLSRKNPELFLGLNSGLHGSTESPAHSDLSPSSCMDSITLWKFLLICSISSSFSARFLLISKGHWLSPHQPQGHPPHTATVAWSSQEKQYAGWHSSHILLFTEPPHRWPLPLHAEAQPWPLVFPQTAFWADHSNAKLIGQHDWLDQGILCLR